ncbi:MAG: DNA-binding response regulator [Acidobacteria bacterium]|nr:MAG: DNA-binding response regulator [Acidobacteriota bacterium]PYV06807.1 MAG: DNA-binding response regulator [Acidobacteriota bacterium]PYV29130.1 MAG: DNA-binding response regulator [Acidobacteriota bacterium]
MTHSDTPKPTIHVLMVDDHKVVRSGLRMLIESHPRMKVVGEAGKGSDALAAASREHPDVILLDLVLGKETGTDLIPGLLAASEESRILVLTALHDEEEHRRAVRLGAMGVLNKEASTELMIKAIEKVYEGEFWLDRFMTASLLAEMRRPAESKKQEPTEDKTARLTAREREVISLVGKGLKNKQIAERLSISESTVRHHLTSVFNKLEVCDRLELLVFAYENGMVAVPA